MRVGRILQHPKPRQCHRRLSIGLPEYNREKVRDDCGSLLRYYPESLFQTTKSSIRTFLIQRLLDVLKYDATSRWNLKIYQHER